MKIKEREFYEVINPKQIEIDDIFISIRDLENRLYYETRQKYFKKLLEKSATFNNSYRFEPIFQIPAETHEFLSTEYFWEDSENNLSKFWHFKKGPEATSSFNSEYYFTYGLTEKEKILHELIEVTEKLKTYYYDLELIDHFRSLEIELSFYLDYGDRILLNPEIYSSFFVIHETKEALKTLRKVLNSFLGKKFIAFIRDIRQSFRNIIKFLFKNMDDEGVENNVLKKIFLKTLSNSQTCCSYGTEKSNKKVICIS